MAQKTIIASAVSLLLLSACTENPLSNNSDSREDKDSQNPTVEQRSLKQLDNNEEFFAALRDGLVRQNGNANYQFMGVEESLMVDSDMVADTPMPTAPTAESGQVGGAGSSAESSVSESNTSGASDNSSRDVTTTNVQEVGVDEQDRMKSDGDFMYILDNQYDYNAVPMPMPVGEGEQGPSIEGEVELVSLEVLVLPNDEDETDNNVDPDIEPLPMGGDIASSSMYIPSTTNVKVRILTMQPDVPDATPVVDLDIDLGGNPADGMYLYKTDSKRNLILTSTSFRNYFGSWNDPSQFERTRSVITKLDVTDPVQANVEKTFQIDGQIISSRRIGSNLFIASRFYPSVPGVDPYSMSAEDYRAALESVDFNEVLPKMTQTDNGVETDLINPAGCFVAPNADSNYSADIVTLAVINLDTLQLEDSECFLGATETLYATPNSVFLATTRWDYSGDQGGAVDVDLAPVDATSNSVDFFEPWFDPRVDTDIHQFTINGSTLNYSGSGAVEGHLGWDLNRKPFRMSEKDGYLRVATMAAQQSEAVSPVNVSVLKLEGDGPLTKVAQLPNENNPAHIGKPREELYASRFLGDRGYLVTFQQTDPLYVIDFSNPEVPTVAGELEIEGYSDYLQPIGEDYLLGIGRDAGPAPEEWGPNAGVIELGVKLSLFNVSDAQNPTEVQSIVVGQSGTHSPALYNHRAITVQAANDLHPTRVTFGIDVAGDEQMEMGEDLRGWNEWLYTGLHGFEVKTGADAGIENTGVMKVATAANGDSRNGYYGDDRSVIVDNSVYYIHGSEVYVADWFNLDNFTGPR